jgi:DNA-binding FadR family transcriptional regulator
MARLAIARHDPAERAALRRLRDRIADEAADREARFAAARDILVALADMTRNRVWQMLARRTRALLASAPLSEMRRRLRRDPGRLVPMIDGCLTAIDAGRPAEALAALQNLITVVGDTGVAAPPPAATAAH